jgi:CRP-like cAMP-binding protein
MYNALISNLTIDDELLRKFHSKINSPLIKLIEVSEEQSYKKGQMLFNEGSMARGLSIIKSGKVKVGKFGVDGKEQIFKILKTGDTLGYEALLFEHRFQEYAEVLENSEILYVGREDFDTICQNEPDVLRYFTQKLCKDLELIEQRLVATSYEPVRGRIATILLELKEIYRNGSAEPVITLSRSDLANMAGTAKETTIRLLSEFKSEGILVTDGQNITIKNHDGLEKVANRYK